MCSLFSVFKGDEIRSTEALLTELNQISSLTHLLTVPHLLPLPVRLLTCPPSIHPSVSLVLLIFINYCSLHAPACSGAASTSRNGD